MNYADMLSLAGGDNSVRAVRRAAFRDDGSLEIVYACNASAHTPASRWLWENRLVISDMEVAGTKIEGVWRTVSIEGREVRDRGGNVVGGEIVQRFSKGYYTAWNWDAVRVQQGDIKHGNEQTVPGVAIGNSELYQRQAVLTLPHVDPARAEAIAAGLTDTAYTNRVAGGIEFGGVWFHMGAAYEVGEDNSASVSLRIGRPQYTTRGYVGEGTPEGQERFYVSGVPMTQAQAVMDAWRTLDGQPDGDLRPGANATMDGGVHFDRNTANIILSVDRETARENEIVETSIDCSGTRTVTTDINQAAPGAPPETPEVRKRVTVRNEKTSLENYNVTTTEETSSPQDVKYQYKPDIDSQQKEERHIAALPTELVNFLNGTFQRQSHGIDFQETNPENLRGVRRRITVDINPDCTLTLAGQSNEPDAAGDELDPPIGESWTVLHDMGMYWNQTKAQIEAVLATLAAQEVGVTKRVEIRRNDLGRFDMTVSVRTHRAFEAEFGTTGDGIQLESKAGINAIEAGLPEVSSGKRDRVSLRITPDEKGQIAWQADKQTVVESDGSATGSGVGVVVSATAYANKDAPVAPTATAPRKRVSPQLQANDDGTFSGSEQVVEVQEVKEDKDIEVGMDGSGIQTRARILQNADDLDSIDFTAGPRKRHSMSVRGNDDGTFSGGATEIEVEKVELKKLDAGPTGEDIGIRQEAGAFLNVDEPPGFGEGADEIPNSSPGVTVQPSLQANDDGTFSGGYRLTDLPEVPLPQQVAGAKLRKQTIDGETNDREVDDAEWDDPKDGETISFRGTANQDGTVTWQRVIERAAGANVEVDGGHKENDFVLTVKTTHHVNEDLAELEDDVPDGNGERVDFYGIRINDDNTCDFTKVSQKLVISDSLTSGVQVMGENIWQKRDQVIDTVKSFVWIPTDNEWIVSGDVRIIGRRQKRQLQRDIQRKFGFARAGATVSGDQRARAGEVRMGPFTVHYVDTENVTIGEWEADGAGLYIETISVDPEPVE